jgi:hypothetical protein
LRVLITNASLAGRSGTTLYARELALGLLERGHTPLVYSTEIGNVGWELRGATVPVIDDLDQLDAAPDIIHGHHNHELFTALLRFPGVPAVRVCHGWGDERPYHFPRVLRYIPVDDTVRDRCLFEWGLPESRVQVLLNWVDLEQFSSRSPLPSRPTRALVFSNNAARHDWAVREACARVGIEVDAVGESAGRVAERPGELLARYDIVFAKARAAMEAMAVGNSVILCDASGMGPMVTSGELDRLRRLNFGVRTLSARHDPERLAAEIARYNPTDAAQVSRRIREEADSGPAIDALIDLYQEVVAEHRVTGTSDHAEELRAASTYLRSLPTRLKEWPDSVSLGLRIILRSLFRRARRLPGLRSLNRSSSLIQWSDGLSRRLRG